MSAAEIPHRVKEMILKQLGRSSFVIRRDQRLPEAVLQKDLPELPLDFHELAATMPDSVKSELNDDVDQICQGRLTLLGQHWPEKSIDDWSLDPESLKHWRWHEYTFDIPRAADDSPGDVKFVWELSRLQHLQVLALGASVLGREDARKLCLEYLDGWLTENPPYNGLGYACGIELASRVVSMLVIITCLGASTIGDKLATRLWSALITHGRWLARFPSLHSSANNHLVAESAALFVLGSVAPGLPGAEKWKTAGWTRLVTEAERQILPDGVGAEQSPTYLAYTMEWLLLARAIHVSSAGDDETKIDDALERGALFIASITDVSGNTPFVGDCDDGVVLRPALTNNNYLASIVAATACCLQSGKLSHPAFAPDLRTHMLTRNPLPESTFTFGNVVFSNGGYSVIRSNENGAEIFVMFDHGPLGFAETAAHGHSDALAVWVHLNGKPVLVDFGTYRYNADDGWRSWARRTAAHNTITINGASQSQATGPFNWGARANGRLIEHNMQVENPHCRASHDGYVGRWNVTHERQVDLDGSAKLVISDDVTGQGTHSISLNFHFSAQVEVKPKNDNEYAIYCDHELIATMSFDCPGLTPDVVTQTDKLSPGPGAVSTEYNVLQSSTSITLSGQVSLPYSCRTTLKVTGPVKGN